MKWQEWDAIDALMTNRKSFNGSLNVLLWILEFPQGKIPRGTKLFRTKYSFDVLLANSDTLINDTPTANCEKRMNLSEDVHSVMHTAVTFINNLFSRTMSSAESRERYNIST